MKSLQFAVRCASKFLRFLLDKFFWGFPMNFHSTILTKNNQYWFDVKLQNKWKHSNWNDCIFWRRHSILSHKVRKKTLSNKLPLLKNYLYVFQFLPMSRFTIAIQQFHHCTSNFRCNFNLKRNLVCPTATRTPKLQF